MKKLLIVSIFLLVPSLVFAQGVEVSDRTGFIEGSLWFSEDRLVDGDEIQIFSAVFNGENQALEVDIEFFDNNAPLGVETFVVLPNETKTVSFDWLAKLGNHDFVARIDSAQVGGSQAILSRIETKHTRTTVVQDINTPNLGNGIRGQINEALNFEEGSLLFEAEQDVVEKTSGIEAWRNKTLESATADRAGVVLRWETDTDASAPVKGMMFFHRIILSFLIFVLKHTFVFYLALFIVVIKVLKKLWKIIRNIFRRKHDEYEE